MTTIQCRCGAVEVEITAEPIVQFYRHYDDCQAVHGDAYAPKSVICSAIDDKTTPSGVISGRKIL